MHLKKLCVPSMSYSCRTLVVLLSRDSHVAQKPDFARVCAIHQEASGSKECWKVSKKVSVFT